MGRTSQTDGNKPHKEKRSGKKDKIVTPEAIKKRINKDGSERKKAKWHPGTVDKREAAKIQRRTDLLLRKKPFERLVRGKMAEIQREEDPTGDDPRFKRLVFPVLQEATERYLVVLYKHGKRASAHGKRVTLMGRDVRLICAIREGGNNPFEPNLPATTGSRTAGSASSSSESSSASE